jgi:hypothetical protein
MRAAAGIPRTSFLWISICALGLFLATNLVGRNAQARSTSWHPKFTTKFSLSPTYYFEDIGQGTSQTAVPVEVEPEFSFKPSHDLKIKIAPYVYMDPVSPSPSERFVADSDETNAELKEGDFVFKLGLNSVSWGVTDVFNPLDVVSAHRYMDPLTSEKRSVPSLDIGYDIGTWRFEGIYVPVQLQSILPGEESRWLPRDVIVTPQSQYKLILPSTLQYGYQSSIEMDSALHNNFGGKIEYHGSGFDLSGIYFEGAPTAPGFNLLVDSSAVNVDPNNKTILVFPNLGLIPVYYRKKTVGFSSVVTFDTLIVRFEAAYSDRITQLDYLPGWEQQAILAFEKNVPVGSTTLTLLGQVTYANHQNVADNLGSSTDRIFDQSWLLGFRVSPTDAWTITAAGLYDAVAYGSYVQAKVERKLTDGLTASLETDFIAGQAGTPLGTYRHNSRAGAGLVYFF